MGTCSPEIPQGYQLPVTVYSPSANITNSVRTQFRRFRTVHRYFACPKPQTGHVVRFCPGAEPWTELWSGSEKFGSKLKFRTRLRYPYSQRGSMGFKSGEDGGCSRFVIPSSHQMLFATVLSHWSAVAYVIDSPNRREYSYVIYTQPMSADVGDSCRIDTSADIS